MIYLIRHGNTNYVKIGYSQTKAGAINRLGACQTGNPIQLSLLGVIDGTQSAETHIQSAYAHKCIRSEWFNLTPGDIRKILNTKDIIKLARGLVEQFLRHHKSESKPKSEHYGIIKPRFAHLRK